MSATLRGLRCGLLGAVAVADVGPDFYDVVVIPRSAVRVPPAEHSVRMPD
jgi:hypothetical protein